MKAAYRLLEAQGLIAARPQSGFYVCCALPEVQHPLRSAPSDVTGKAPDDLIAQVLAAQQRADHIDLALACPRGAKFYPSERLARMTNYVLRHQTEVVGTYALPPGSPLLREQIVRRGQRLGMKLSADDVVITHGCLKAATRAPCRGTCR